MECLTGQDEATRLEDDASDAEDALGVTNAINSFVGYGTIHGEHHERLTARARFTCEGSYVHTADIDTSLAKDGADAPDHSWAVYVVTKKDMTLRHEIGDLLIDTHDALGAPGDRRGEHVRGSIRAISAHANCDEIGVLLVGGGGATLGDFQSPVTREHRRVNQVDVRLGDRLQQPLDQRSA